MLGPRATPTHRRTSEVRHHTKNKEHYARTQTQRTKHTMHAHKRKEQSTLCTHTNAKNKAHCGRTQTQRTKHTMHAPKRKEQSTQCTHTNAKNKAHNARAQTQRTRHTMHAHKRKKQSALCTHTNEGEWHLLRASFCLNEQLSLIGTEFIAFDFFGSISEDVFVYSRILRTPCG